MRQRSSPEEVHHPKPSDLSCIIITFGIITAAITPIQIGGLSIGRFAAVLIILICARSGEPGGAIAGITAGVAIALADSRFTYLTGTYGIGGLMAGVFAPFGRFASAVIFVVVNGIGVIVSDKQYMPLIPVYEAFAASAVYMLLPSKLLDLIKVNYEDQPKIEEKRASRTFCWTSSILPPRAAAGHHRDHPRGFAEARGQIGGGDFTGLPPRFRPGLPPVRDEKQLLADSY